jgi:hypothetical protein
MKNNPWKLILLSVLGLFFLWAMVKGFTVKEKPEIIFSHRLHLEDVGLECEACHGKVSESKSGRDNLMPEKSTCLNCHHIEECSLCHSRPDGPTKLERFIDYSPKFSHAKHLNKDVPARNPLKDITCERCHPGISLSDSSSSWHIPGMALCTSCHDGVQQTKDCIICHDHPRSKVPPDHILPVWKNQHGDDARMDNGASCKVCHERDDCQECHQGDNLLPRAHPPGFQFKHGIELRTGRTECAACHQDRSFCIDCHLTMQVYPFSHQRPNWTSQTPGVGGRHAAQALMNIETCAACHSDEPGSEPVCADCHGR